MYIIILMTHYQIFYSQNIWNTLIKRPTYKKNNKTVGPNYRPISILPNKSKAYEKCMHLNLRIFFLNFSAASVKDKLLNLALCPLLKKMASVSWLRWSSGIFLINLSKAFGRLSHGLLQNWIAYGVDRESLLFSYFYLKSRKQTAKFNISYSRFNGIISDVSQGFVLVPLLLNIYIWIYRYATYSMKVEIWILLVVLMTILQIGALKNWTAF